MTNPNELNFSAERERPRDGSRRGLRLVRICALVSSVLLVIALCCFKIANLDLGYHLAYGNYLLETGEIVGFQPDPFLRSETAIPFVNLNWGSQLILALVERIGGVSALFGLRLVLVGLALLAGVRMVWRHVQSVAVVSFALLLISITAYERFSLRPELFSYALLAWMLWRLDAGLRRRRDVAALIVMQVLLVNLHSYFLLGVALTVAFAVGHSIESVWPRHTADDATTPHASGIKHYWLAVAIQVAVCFMHPWHIEAVALPFQTVGYLAETGAMGAAGDTSQSSWAAISEFQSPFSFLGQSINAVTIYAYLLLLGLATVGCLAMLLRRQWAWTLVTIGVALVSFKMRRNIAPFAFIVGPLAILSIIQLRRVWGLRRSDVARLSANAVVCVVTIAMCYFVVSGRLYYIERRTTRQLGTGYSDLTFSTAAIDWLVAHPTVGPELYVDYFASSNALMGLPAGFKLYVDTNTFAFDEATLRQTQDLEQGRADANAFFDQNGINVVLLRAGSNTQLLIRSMIRDRTSWALAYVDRAHVIFLRRGIKQHTRILIDEEPADLDEAWAQQEIANTTGPAFQRALSLTTIANVPLSLGFDRAALPLLAESIRLAPDHGEAWSFIGVAHGNLGNAAARKRDYDKAAKHWNEAIEAFERAVESQPTNDAARVYLANTKKLIQMLDGQR